MVMIAQYTPVPLLIGLLLILLLKKQHASKIAIIAAISTLVISGFGLMQFMEAASQSKTPEVFAIEMGFDWFNPGINFEFGILLDNLSMFMLPLVAFITSLVFIYAHGYMEKDSDLKRFFATMCLFALSMMGIILAGNLLVLFFAWEMVGLSSYLLIGFWYPKASASRAMRKAFTIITIGDIAMFAGMAILIKTFGTLSFVSINQAGQPAVLASFLILIGAFSKSAQFPLHVWLPDAMEGPTPVSALLHSATMVKAGIFLIARFYPLLEASGMLPLIAWVGLISAILPATIALVENDIKRVLAYSTISHLGFMTIGLGIGAFSASMFHMFNHSFFKAMLFLMAGILIHQSHSQDIRKIFFGNRMLRIVTLFGVLALAGVPFFNGFWSKDQIIEAAAHANLGPMFYPLVLFATFLSALYIFRWFFIMNSNQGEPNTVNTMVYPVLLLSIFVIFSGFIMKPFYEWFGSHAHGFVQVLLAPSALTSMAIVSIAFGITFFAYHKKSLNPETFRNNPVGSFLHRTFSNGYWIDNLYEKIFVSGVVTFSRILHTIDKIVIDRAVNLVVIINIRIGKLTGSADTRAVDGTVDGIGDGLKMWGSLLRKVVTGYIQSYMTWIIGGIGILIFFNFLILRGWLT